MILSIAPIATICTISWRWKRRIKNTTVGVSASDRNRIFCQWGLMIIRDLAGGVWLGLYAILLPDVIRTFIGGFLYSPDNKCFFDNPSGGPGVEWRVESGEWEWRVEIGGWNLNFKCPCRLWAAFVDEIYKHRSPSRCNMNYCCWH